MSKSIKTSRFQKPAYLILLGISVSHLLNDMMQSVIPSMYPYMEQKFSLSMGQIGMITLCFQLAASIFQPVVGNFTDRRPQPYSQVIGMVFSAVGMVFLAYADSYFWILVSVILVGIGSSVFHPESSRVAFLASGGRRSFAQAVFQIGGNSGAALAPLLVAWIVIPNDQRYILIFVSVAIVGKIILGMIGKWYSIRLKIQRIKPKKQLLLPDLSPKKIVLSIVILLILIISKYFYVASITSYFQFYTMGKFELNEIQAQIYLFYFLISVAAGVLLGGFLGDIFGRKFIIWFSVLGAAPFTLLLPYANLFWTGFLIVIVGLIISSAFPAILVFAQELLPKKIGMVSGLFYGFAFGMGGLGSALLGIWADHTSIDYIYNVCSFLPLLGAIAYFLPDMRKVKFKSI